MLINNQFKRFYKHFGACWLFVTALWRLKELKERYFFNLRDEDLVVQFPTGEG